MNEPVRFQQGDMLVCPGCGETTLHQEKCTAFWRVEDAETGLQSVSNHSNTYIRTSMVGNPSGRRDGIVIRFSCECCPAEPELLISQHKGMTFVRWA